MELFKAKLGSPVTQLAENITNTQTTISLVNADVLPDAPNIATIGTGVNAETIRYSGKTLNTLTGVTRGFTGTAKAWTSGQPIARIFTQYDHDSLVESVETHLADNVSELIDISRDLSLNGEQIISLSKGKTPKAIYALVTNASLDTWSNGFCDENRNQACIYKFKDDNRVARYSGYLIALSADTTANRKRASVSSMNANQLVLNWSNVGTGVIDTGNIQLLVMYHGGE